MKRVPLAVAIALLSALALGQTALAGEWNPAKGDVAAKTHGGSACLFNGRDQPDESAPGAGDGEPIWHDANGNGTYDEGEPVGGDDALWGSTRAGGNVQSYGQIVAAGLKDFVPSPGFACNPTSGFEE